MRSALLPPRLALPALLALLAACAGFGAKDPAVTASCAALSAPDPATARQIDPGVVDQWLIDEALLNEVNAQRCRRGIPPLAPDPALARAASMHSGDMVVHGFFSHDSPVPGRATVRDRGALAGASYPRVAENLAEMPLHGNVGRHVYEIDREACAFSLTPSGPPIPRLTYAGAAEAAVGFWMDSPGHRRNLLSPDLTRHGAGASIRPAPEKCGELVIVQDLAGE